MSNEKIKVNPIDLTYIDEERDLASTMEDEFLNWLESETKPESITDEKLRAEYVAFLEEGGYELPA